MSVLYCFDYDSDLCKSHCYISSTGDLPLVEKHGYCVRVRKEVVWCAGGFVWQMVKALRKER